MKHLWMTVPFLWSCLLTAPLLAQTKIGGGTCNSSSLNGNYAVSITARQVTNAGTFSNVFQANGSANFDGLNKVTLTLTSNTLQALGTPVTWSGTYSLQANCAGVATITTGGSATLNLAVYNQGSNFLLTGNDATYSYSGSGNTPPATCSSSLLSGPYTVSGTGFGYSGTAVNGGSDATGLLQFDGKGGATANFTISSGGTTTNVVTANGPYSVSSNCQGSATLTDSKGNSYVLNLSIYSGNATVITDFFTTVAQASKFLIAGSAHTVASDTCSVSSLSGTYSMVLSGRAISAAGSFAGSFQANGTATFDGQGKVTFTGTANTNLATGKQFTYSGTYSLPPNCSGTMTLTTASAASFNLVAWSAGKQFDITGADATYVYSGSGGSVRPPSCATATLSDQYTYDASGFTLSGTAQNGAADESGVFTFDGQGNLTASYTVSSSGTSTAITSTGTYSVTPNCLGSATLTDSTGKSNSLNFSIVNLYGQGVDVLEANSQFVRTGSAHAAFLNPTQSIGNVASYAVNATPPGSVFVLFGENLAARAAGATGTPLPTSLASATVTVNGEPAPLFYVSSTQIDAQMPWDIPTGAQATVIVKNGTSTSNAVAVSVPATGTPGISVYPTNRAVVVNQDGSVNSPSAGASAGDQVVAYFTGGGPVQAAGKLVTGAPAPDGLSSVTGDYAVTVGGVTAIVKYIGLTPESIGLYQVNFVVPQLPKGTYPVVITIDGYASNNPVMTISN
jgi:uncharacterized protein (TIGR03437 family)